MNKQIFDVIVIGAGPGGYVAAIKASQLGKKVALIEKQYMGGTCLNVGCIPSKALLAGADVLQTVLSAKEFGIEIENISVDYNSLKERKDTVVGKIRKSLEGLLVSNGITIIRGKAEFTSPYEIKVMGENPQFLGSEQIIIATGSEPLDIASFPCDHKKIFNSTSILELTQLPSSIAIVGGGYIGCEFASLFARFGVKVTILEALDSIVSLQGKSVSEALSRAFTKQGIDIKTGVSVEKIDTGGDGVCIHLKGGANLNADIALVSIGRKIASDSLCLEKAGLKTGPKGEIVVDDQLRTSVKGIYAIGDVTGKYMLAHVASHQAIVAATNACGKQAFMHYEAVPAVIFTHPEIATVGLTLEQATQAGYEASVGKFPFQALGKAIAIGDTDGFAQVIIEKKTGRILGAQVVGKDASVLIAEIAIAISSELTIENIIDTIHAHPTLAELWLEAALLAKDEPIHFPPKVKK